MRPLWWSLPGPSGFARLAADDLLDGKNLCLLLPSVMPRGLKTAIKDQFPDPEGWDWRDLNLAYIPAEEASRPEHLLFDVFCREALPGTIRSSANLLREPDFHGKLIWLEGLDPETWPAWRNFLQQYAEQSRNLPVHDRTRFIIVLEGIMTAEPPQPLITLSVRAWEGIVDKLDMMLYCSSLFSKSSLGPLQKSLAVHLCANLAKWDPHTADRLCGLELPELLDPVRDLAELAEEYGYTGTESQWLAGTFNRMEGKPYVHSAFLAAADAPEQLERRIWEAQLSILFPALEELRLALLDYLDSQLTVLFQPLVGRAIEQKIDLEIGHIYHQIRYSPEIDLTIRQHIRHLVDLRNDLAHLKPVGPYKLHLIDALERLPDLLATS